jgi:integrase
MDGFAATFPPVGRRAGSKTRHPGIYRINESTFRVRVVATDPTGKRRQAERIVDGTLEDALAARADLSAELKSEGLNGETGPLPRRPTVAQWAAAWLESKALVVAESTLDRYTDMVHRHVIPALGSKFMHDLRPTDLQWWINRQKGTAETVRTRAALLVNLMRDGVSQLDMERDPARRLIVPEPPEPAEDNRLMPEQFWPWLDAFKRRAPEQYAYALTLAMTGMRPCHVRALRWEDVDFEGGALRPRMKVYLGKVSPASKKKRAPREFPLWPDLAAALREHKAWLNAPMTDYHLGPCLRHPGAASGLCFPNREGKPQCQSKVWRVWQDVNQEVGVQINARGLRRTFNDLLRLSGVDPFTAGALTAQTPSTRERYQTVGFAEKTAAVGKVLRLVGRDDG